MGAWERAGLRGDGITPFLEQREHRGSRYGAQVEGDNELTLRAGVANNTGRAARGRARHCGPAKTIVKPRADPCDTL